MLPDGPFVMLGDIMRVALTTGGGRAADTVFRFAPEVSNVVHFLGGLRPELGMRCSSCRLVSSYIPTSSSGLATAHLQPTLCGWEAADRLGSGFCLTSRSLRRSCKLCVLESLILARDVLAPPRGSQTTPSYFLASALCGLAIRRQSPCTVQGFSARLPRETARPCLLYLPP